MTASAIVCAFAVVALAVTCLLAARSVSRHIEKIHDRDQ